jgi:hypothetical protein
LTSSSLLRNWSTQARAEGVQLVGGGGLLTGLTKAVVETALEEEMSDHLGYDKHDPVGRTGGNRSFSASRRSAEATSLLRALMLANRLAAPENSLAIVAAISVKRLG